MDKFIVSARKYRPQTFDTVVGQSHITTTLKNAIRVHQLAHAFLFCGPRGVGKTTCARILAKTINCENQTPEGEACNVCPSCISFNEGTSLNYFELDAASNNSVDNIRELVDQVRFVPQSGEYKVYVIDEVHMLSSSAFNAFLKTLEEPPPYAIFILATTEKHKILPTILSRCQIFDFKRISLQDTVKHLQEICEKEEIKADKASLQVIAQKSEGCMRDALSILDKIVSFTNGKLTYGATLEHLNILDAEVYFNMLKCMEEQDLSGALVLYNDIDRKGFEGDLVLNGFAEFIRNLLVCKDEKAADLLEVVESFRQRYVETGKKTSLTLLIAALNVLNESEITYKAARNKRLHVEMALIKLCYLRQAIELSATSGDLSKKKIVEPARSIPFRKIIPLEVSKKEKTRIPKAEAKLIIEVPSPSFEQPLSSLNGTKTRRPLERANEIVEDLPQPVLTRISALDKIRKQYQGNDAAANGKTNHPLNEESLQKAWNAYIQVLKSAKNPAAQVFEMAILRIIGDHSFEVLIEDNLSQKFIEKERNKLFAHLQESLENQLLRFSVIIEERPGDKPPVEVSLTAREQFLQMAERYPLVKELKERLRLELDY